MCLPALLLVAVALHQHWLARRSDLSAWSGGGFGMFSTIDGWGARHLHVYALSPAFQQEIALPSELRDAARRVLALPSEARLRAFALALAPYAPRDLEDPESIRVDVFARRYDPDSLAPGGALLRSLVVPLDPAPR